MNDDTTIQTVNARVAALEPATEPGTLVECLGLIDDMMRRLKELKAEAEARAIEIIDAHGPFTFGEVRYYVGVDKSYKLIDAGKATEALLTASGGDFDAFADCLASGAYKHGAVRKLLEGAGVPEQFESIFDVSERKDLKTGKPERKLQKLNPNFIR